jgi:hypothetical protein
MGLFCAAAAALIFAQAAWCAQPLPPEQPDLLVREVVYNELQDHLTHGFWRFWVQRQVLDETYREDQVETAEGPIARLFLRNGGPLTLQSQQQEQSRIENLLNSPWQQARHRQDYDDAEQRIGRIEAMLPDAFLYENDGEEKGCHRLRFRPNPNYVAHTIEARIFHAMSGTLCVDTRYKRLTQLDGRLQENVDFGFGILGRLRKGGWFELKRKQVSATNWKTEGLEVHLSGRAVLFKSISQQTSEARGGFVQVRSDMNLAQGMALLQAAPSQGEAKPTPPSFSEIPLNSPTAFALRP